MVKKKNPPHTQLYMGLISSQMEKLVLYKRYMEALEMF